MAPTSVAPSRARPRWWRKYAASSTAWRIRSPDPLAISPDGAYLYTASFGTGPPSDPGAVAIFGRDAITGHLTFLGKAVNGVGGFSGIGQPNRLAMSPDGAQLYVASWMDQALTALTRDLSTGALSVLNSAPVPAGPDLLAPSADGKWIMMASSQMALDAFTRDPGTGRVAFAQQLTDGIDGVTGLNGSIGVAISPDSHSVYGQGLFENALSEFHVTCGNDTLDPGEQCDDGASNGTAAFCCTAACEFLASGTACTGGSCNATGTCVPFVCGNGVVEGAEQCDNGPENGTLNSCCTSTCTFQPAVTACADEGDLCTQDLCAGTADTCTHPVAPSLMCATPTVAQGASLLLQTKSPGHNRAQFKWGKGPLVPLTDFGNPTSAVTRLCVYDQTGPGSYALALQASPSVSDGGTWLGTSTDGSSRARPAPLTASRA
jgi:6-phosphogluconolactonase (cycloisomerase 2 family)